MNVGKIALKLCKTCFKWSYDIMKSNAIWGWFVKHEVHENIKSAYNNHGMFYNVLPFV